MFPLNFLEPKLSFLNSIGGFPLRPSPKEPNSLVLNKAEILKLMLTTVGSNLSCIMMVPVYFTELHGRYSLHQIMDSLGYSFFDAATNGLTGTLLAVASVIVFVAFARNRDRLVEACNGLKTVSRQLKLTSGAADATMKLVHSKGKFLGLLAAIGFAANVVALYFMYDALVPHGGNGLLKVLFISTCAFSFAMSFFNPLIIGGCLLSFFLIVLLTKCFEEFHAAMTAEATTTEKDKNKKTPSTLENIEDSNMKGRSLIGIGLQLCRTNEDLNDALGSLLLVIISATSTAGTVLIYGESSIVFGSFRVHKIFVAFCYSFTGWAYFLALYHLCSAGQALEDARRKAKEALADRVMRLAAAKQSSDMQTSVLLHEWSVLDARLGQEKAVSPLHFFGVNHAGYLCVMSTIFTYLIVLIQFKVDGN